MALRLRQDIEEAVAAFLAACPEVNAGYLFGSVVSGRARPDSDVDVALLLSDDVLHAEFFPYRLRRMSDLMGILRRDDVDLVILNEAPPLLAHRVLKNGKLIFERSATARVAFQVRALNRYFDTQPMRNLYLAYLKKHAAEGRIFGR